MKIKKFHGYMEDSSYLLFDVEGVTEDDRDELVEFGDQVWTEEEMKRMEDAGDEDFELPEVPISNCPHWEKKRLKK